MSDLPRGVAVIGPTASGKSSVALAVAAAEADVELVSVDSMQVYRGMNIGTAKPTAAERALVPHHLIDLVDPTDEFTVAEFQRAYVEVLDDISGRGCRALLVGGTGLYHRAAIDGLDLPSQWPDVRARLQVEAGELGGPVLHRRLVDLDPQAAAKIEPTNVRRIVRALEVCEGSGRPFSSYGPGLETYPASAIVQIGLRWDRARLAERIEHRVHRMMADGLLQEVTSLVDTGLSRTAAQALGYKELIGHIDGSLTLEAAVEQIVVRTRQFAVRQLRWFQRDPRIRWVEVQDDPVAEATSIVCEALGAHHV